MTGIAFSPDSSMVATGCRDGTIRLWNAAARSDPFVLAAPATVYALAFSPDGTRLATASLSGELPLRVWNVGSAAEVAAMGDGTLSAVGFDADASRIALGRSHADTTIVDARDGTVLATLKRHWWRTDWVAFAPGGEHLVSVGMLMVHDSPQAARIRRCACGTRGRGVKW